MSDEVYVGLYYIGEYDDSSQESHDFMSVKHIGTFDNVCKAIEGEGFKIDLVLGINDVEVVVYLNEDEDESYEVVKFYGELTL